MVSDFIRKSATAAPFLWMAEALLRTIFHYRHPAVHDAGCFLDSLPDKICPDFIAESAASDRDFIVPELLFICLPLPGPWYFCFPSARISTAGPWFFPDGTRQSIWFEILDIADACFSDGLLHTPVF